MRLFFFIFSILILFSGTLTGQVKPNNFLEETSPSDANFEVYSQKNGVNRRATLSNLAKAIAPVINPTPIAYTPTASGNVANLRKLVLDPFGNWYYIDPLGNAIIVRRSDAVGGDLSGNLPTPTVAKIQGRAVSAAAPDTGQVLKWNGSQWAPAADSAGGPTRSGIYGDGSVGSGNDTLPIDGTEIALNREGKSLRLKADFGNTSARDFIILESADDAAASRWMSMLFPSDSFKIYRAGGAYSFQAYGTNVNWLGKTLRFYMDSVQFAESSFGSASRLRYLGGFNAGKYIKGLQGESANQVLKWDGADWYAGADEVNASGHVLKDDDTAMPKRDTLAFISTSAIDIAATDVATGGGRTEFRFGIKTGAVGAAELENLVSPGSCTNCQVTFDADGRASAFSTGPTEILQGGNSLATPVTLGTNDNQPLNFEVNNIEALSIGTNYSVTATASVANTNSAANRLILRSNSAGTPTSGFGSTLLFQAESSTTDNTDQSYIASSWTNASHANKSSAFTLGGWRANTWSPYVSIDGFSAFFIGSGQYDISSNVRLRIGNGLATEDGLSLHSSNTNLGSVRIGFDNNCSLTSGHKKVANIAGTFIPSSGTAQFTQMVFGGVMSQSSGGTGITRCVLIDPSTSGLADFRAIEISSDIANGKGVYQSGSALVNIFNGKTSFGTTSSPSTDAVEVTGNISLMAAGNKLKVATGANASAGSATLTSGTVTVNTTAVTASSIIILTPQSCTSCGALHISAKSAGTSFTITSSNGADASSVGWLIIN